MARQAAGRPYTQAPAGPARRPLQIYTLDPSVSDRLGGTASVAVPYEPLEPGPVGAVFAVDWRGAPAPLRAASLDLDDPHLLLAGGLAPSPADGRFHLQMVYAVCSLTYAAFRRALGRDVAWAMPSPEDGGPARLVVRPFGSRGRNTGYSREAGDLTFGYFDAGPRPAGFTLPGGLVCTALSHDVIVHETTHALLDGLRSTFYEPTNPDVPAFHEGFADLVALFMHFSYPGVVAAALRDWRSAFSRGSVLTDLAREFGYARGTPARPGALRSGVDLEGVAAFDADVPPGAVPGPICYDAGLPPHALGSVLVSAVFEAFVTVVRRKTARYFRMAGMDPGSSPVANDALLSALATETSDVATHFLDICIRAIDYCPAADMELGEYLRALITADTDVEAPDHWGYREALMRSFRRRQIFPEHVAFMTEDAVRWQPPGEALTVPGLAFRDLRFDGDPGRSAGADELVRQAHALGRFVTSPDLVDHFRLVAPAAPPPGVVQASPAIVQSVRVTRRVTPDGRVDFGVVGEVTQTCTVRHRGALFDVQGGCTVVLDPQGRIRYAIYKRFDSERRRERQHRAMRTTLRAFWQRTGNRYRLRPGVLRRLHGAR